MTAIAEIRLSVKNITFKATVETQGGNMMSYIGFTGTSFKTRYAKHKKSLRTQSRQTALR